MNSCFTKQYGNSLRKLDIEDDTAEMSSVFENVLK